jgi:hypothetical protein
MRNVRTECTLEQCMEFIHCVREAGIQTDPWYEAVPYNGPAKRLSAALYVNRGLLSKKYIAGADNREEIERVMRYIKSNPKCHDWRLGVDTGQWELEPGYFAIVERCAFRGGDRRPVIKLLRSFGLDQEVIDDTLNDKSEELLGYTLSANAEEAQQLARIIEVGATRRPDGYVPLAARAALFEKMAEDVPSTAECTWGRMANRHRLARTGGRLAQRFDEAYQLERSYEPVWELLSQGTVNKLVDDIMDSATLDTNDKIEACLALGVALEGCIPPPEGITSLEKAFGSDFVRRLKEAKAKLSSFRKEPI